MINAAPDEPSVLIVSDLHNIFSRPCSRPLWDEVVRMRSAWEVLLSQAITATPHSQNALITNHIWTLINGCSCLHCSEMIGMIHTVFIRDINILNMLALGTRWQNETMGS